MITVIISLFELSSAGLAGLVAQILILSSPQFISSHLAPVIVVVNSDGNEFLALDQVKIGLVTCSSSDASRPATLLQSSCWPHLSGTNHADDDLLIV